MLFSRIGIPRENLTDQGSNFTSQLLTEVYQLLHVHPIQTTPYHPTDRWPGREVQPDPQMHATEDSHTGRQRLGQAAERCHAHAARPDTLDDMYLAEFAANYTARSGQESPYEEANDTLPPPEDEGSGRCPRIELMNDLGHMYKAQKRGCHRLSQMQPREGSR